MSDEYVPVRFPAWRYHASQEARIVNTPEEEKALGHDWYDSPVKAKAVAEPKKEVEHHEKHKKVK